MNLDFTGLNQITLKGFETEEEQEARDSLLQAGFTFVKSPDNPFTAPQSSAAVPVSPASPQPITAPSPASSGGKGAPFTDHTGSRSYKRMYRQAIDFHQRHAPPHVEREYWRTHTPGEDDIPEAEARYWDETTKDMIRTSAAGNNDPFLMGFLMAITDELEREYMACREEAAGMPSRSSNLATEAAV